MEENTPPSEAPQTAPPSEPQEGKPPWRHRGRVFWVEWIKPLLIIGLVMFSFRSAVADWNDVPTGSMKPNILEGDRIFINKVAYDLKFPFTTVRLAWWEDPEWGDVVVLRSPEDRKRLVKRVVGLPEDVIEIRGNYLFRNGEQAIYNPLPDEEFDFVIPERGERLHFFEEDIDGSRHPIMLTRGGGILAIPGSIPPPSCGQPPEDFQPRFRNSWICALGEKEFFVMGDNRNNSRDSRYFGPVHRDLVLGQATAVALSVDRDNYFKPRWWRFFTELP